MEVVGPGRIRGGYIMETIIEPQRGTRAVLVVDDEPGVLRLLKIVLREIGCEVYVVNDAEAALQELARLQPGVVLTDVRLPGIDGLELARRIHADTHLRDAHVILMSAYGKPSGIHGDIFIPKPFDLEALVETVRRYAED